jgi:hypothetical protein
MGETVEVVKRGREFLVESISLLQKLVSFE